MKGTIIDRTIVIEITSSYRDAAQRILKEEQDLLATIKDNTQRSALKRFEIAELMLNLASNYLVISGISQSMLGQRDENALNEARKTLYKSVIYLEEIVTGRVDVPYSDYEEQLASIEHVGPSHRYYFVQKMGLAIDLLKSAYGDNTKWKWSFVELEGRFAAVAKNLLNLRDLIINSDPRSPHYQSTVYHLRLIKKLLAQTADRYREKYEQSTAHVNDFKIGINFLSSLKRLNTITGSPIDVIAVQKKIDVWNNKLAADISKQQAQLKG